MEREGVVKMSEKRMEAQDEQILKWMLGQIYRAEKRKKQLDERLMRINEERNAPIGGQGYEPMPRASSIGNGAASILLKIAEIEERIYQQRTEIEKSIVRVMDILDFLPIDSIGREICELRHIDMMKWKEIEEEIPMSHSQVNKNYQKAIRQLLSFSKIRQMVNENRDAFEEYVCEQGERKAKGLMKNQSGGSDSENKSGNFQEGIHRDIQDGILSQGRGNGERKCSRKK